MEIGEAIGMMGYFISIFLLVFVLYGVYNEHKENNKNETDKEQEG